MTTLKQFLSFICVIGLLLFSSCGGCVYDGETVLKDYGVITIDSCEYIYVYGGLDNGGLFTHKGNCRSCQERLDKRFQSLGEK